MTDEEFARFCGLVNRAKALTREALDFMDGVEGCAPGVEQSFAAALASLDGVLDAEQESRARRFAGASA
jgi:hypothetical protein